MGGVDSGLGRDLCCCVFSVKQLVTNRKGRISEEIRSKYHLPTYRSRAGLRGERERLKQWPGLKRTDVSGLWQWRLKLSFHGHEPSICSFLFPPSLPFSKHMLNHFCCALHYRMSRHERICSAGFRIA